MRGSQRSGRGRGARAPSGGACAREAGVTAVELVVAVGVFAILAAAAMAFFSSSLTLVSDLQTDSSLWSRLHTCAMRLRDDMEEADIYDSLFQVTSTTARFRLVASATDLGTRTYGNTITYAIEGPTTSIGGQQVYKLVRYERDTTNTTLLRKQDVLVDLTSPTDATAPSRFSFASPHITVQLVMRLPGRTAGETVSSGLRENIRLRYQ